MRGVNLRAGPYNLLYCPRLFTPQFIDPSVLLADPAEVEKQAIEASEYRTVV